LLYRFGTFTFDDESGELHGEGRGVPLEPQPARGTGPRDRFDVDVRNDQLGRLTP
jgi:hypothetical protein